MIVATEVESSIQKLRSLADKARGRDKNALTEAVEVIYHSLSNAWLRAAQDAKQAENPEQEVAVWADLSALCSIALAEVKASHNSHSDSSTGEFYDKLLDLKLACEERKNWVLEELACQKKLPKGLFPEKS